MELQEKSFNLSKKFIENTPTTLKVDLMAMPIDLALQNFIDFKKVAVITRHSIRGEDYSELGDLIEIGQIAAENLGKKIKNLIGPHEVSYFSTNVARCKSTCKFINKGWNDDQDPEINLEKSPLIDSNYFDYSGTDWSWVNITNLVLNSEEIKEQALSWKENFLQEMPEGLSWWVSHDSFVLPLVYTLTNFDPQEYSRIKRFENLPWTSPLTGIIIAVGKDDEIFIKAITGLETGFVDSNDYDHDFTDDALIPQDLELNRHVATTYSHPDAVFINAFQDEDYIFDDETTKGNPLYCENLFEGCVGQCVSCQTCVDCQTDCYDSCVSCNSCQNCVDCQTGCQTRGYGYAGNLNSFGAMVPKEEVIGYDTYCRDGLTKLIRREKWTWTFKCDESCMQCNNESYSCNTCYTGEHIVYSGKK